MVNYRDNLVKYWIGTKEVNYEMKESRLENDLKQCQIIIKVSLQFIS